MPNAELLPAIDAQGLVHLTWAPHTKREISLCSSVTVCVHVAATKQEFPTCLRCIDIATRFW